MSLFGEMQRAFRLDHPNFVIDPMTDWVCYFGRDEAKATLNSIILKSFKAQIPPKLVLFGDWGIGKTQTIYHFMNKVLKGHSYPIYVECPEFARKTNFLDFYSILLNRIRSEQLIPLLRKYNSATGGFNDLLEPDFRYLCQNVLTISSGDTLSAAWKWLSGQNLNTQEKERVGVTESQLSVTMAINILSDIGNIFMIAEGKPLVFCIDEAHRLGNIDEDSDHERTFVQALRKISQRTFPVGFIFAIGSADEAKFPHMFVLGEVKSRIGDYYVRLPELDPANLREMMLGIIRYVRDGWDTATDTFKSPKTDVIKAVEDLKKKGIDAPAETFPFSNEAIDQMLIHFDTDDMRNKRTPREICDFLNDCATEESAIKAGYIDGNTVNLLARARGERARPSVSEED